jgi:hypothetical protein
VAYEPDRDDLNPVTIGWVVPEMVNLKSAPASTVAVPIDDRRMPAVVTLDPAQRSDGEGSHAGGRAPWKEGSTITRGMKSMTKRVLCIVVMVIGLTAAILLPYILTAL